MMTDTRYCAGGSGPGLCKAPRDNFIVLVTYVIEIELN